MLVMQEHPPIRGPRLYENLALPKREKLTVSSLKAGDMHEISDRSRRSQFPLGVEAL